MNAMVKHGPHAAQWCAVVVIPSAGHRAKGEGTDGASLRRTPTGSKKEREVRLRAGYYCDAHKPATLDKLMRRSALEAWCSRLQAHYGHGALLINEARLEWVAVDEPCDCAVLAPVAPVAKPVRGAANKPLPEGMMG